jgi:molybdopterin converting factor small subunit
MNVEEGLTLKQLLLQISSKYPRFEQSVFDIGLQKLDEKVCIFHNGRQSELENGIETILKDGDCLVFLPFIQGG